MNVIPDLFCLEAPQEEADRCDCAFHTWMKERQLSPIVGINSVLSAKSALKRVRVSFLRGEKSTSAGITSNLDLFRKRRKLVRASRAEYQLARFINVLRLVSTAPWAPLSFSVNESMINRLIVSHLPLIVGFADWEQHRSALVGLVDESLFDTTNVVWVTNRQQGKTTTLSKFLAVLAVLSVVGGNLCCVYSTNLDRAQELTRAAKKYLYWLQTEDNKAALSEIGVDPPVFVVDNERVFSIRQKNVVNTVIARPKSADSCRGDAPRAAIFDEIAFVSADFWFKVSFSDPAVLVLPSLTEETRGSVCLPAFADLKTGLYLCHNTAGTGHVFCNVCGKNQRT